MLKITDEVEITLRCRLYEDHSGSVEMVEQEVPELAARMAAEYLVGLVAKGDPRGLEGAIEDLCKGALKWATLGDWM